MEARYKFIIQGELPNLNTEIEAAKQRGRTGRVGHIYAAHKKQWTSYVRMSLVRQFSMQGGNTIEDNCGFIIKWYVKNKKKDPDNIEFGIKYILDGLQQLKVIPNDGFCNTSLGKIHKVYIDKEKPRVEVYIFEYDFISKLIDSLC